LQQTAPANLVPRDITALSAAAAAKLVVRPPEDSRMAMRPKELQAALKLLHGILSERWTPQRLDEHSWGFQHVAGWVPLSCYAKTNRGRGAFLFRPTTPLPVEPARRGLVAEYIARVNYPLPVGNWAIDLDTGDVRWKAGLYFGGAGPSEPLIRH